MKIYHLPFDQTTDPVIIKTYDSDHSTNRNKIVLERNMINLVIAGEKQLYHTDGNIKINAGEMVLIGTGNVLTTEVKPDHTNFRSVIIYFTNELLLKYDLSFIHIAQDEFIRHYVNSLEILLKSADRLSNEMKLLKLEELLLYIRERYPPKIEFPNRDEDALIQQVMENNITTPVTVEDLAFLCNCSLSSFKRKFAKRYNTSPQKWLVEQKLALAAQLLSSPLESPATVYLKVGYENHSSFSQAFKSKYGVSPKDYHR